MQAAAAFSSPIPVVETERLRLRGHRRDDFAACCALWSDPVVTKYTSGKALTPEEVWAKILRYRRPMDDAGLRLLGGRGEDVRRTSWESWASATFSAISHLHSTECRSADGLSCRAYTARVMRRRPCGQRSTGVMRTFASERPAASFSPENSASIRVAEKCGYHEWQPATYKEHDVLIFTR